MPQTDTQLRTILAAERFALLRTDASASARRTGQMRRRLGGMLVAAGLRLAPDATVTVPERSSAIVCE